MQGPQQGPTLAHFREERRANGRHWGSCSYEMDFQVWAQGGHFRERLSRGERERTCFLTLRLGWFSFSVHELVKTENKMVSPGFTVSDVSGNENGSSRVTSHFLTSDVCLTEPATVPSLLFESGVFLLVRPELSRVSDLFGATLPPLLISAYQHFPVISCLLSALSKVGAQDRNHDFFFNFFYAWYLIHLSTFNKCL